MKVSVINFNGWLKKMAILMLPLVFTSSAVIAGAQPPLPPDLGQEDITLEKAIDLAHRYNPSMLIFAAAEQQTLAEAMQTSRGLNPELGFEVENFAGSGSHNGFSAAEYTLALSQTFEMGGKRRKERDLADWAVKEVGQDEISAGLQVENLVVEAFITNLKAQQQIDLSTKLVQLAEENLDFVRRRVAMGAVSSIEENQALVDVHWARLELESARQAHRLSRIRLSSLWNAPTATFGQARGSLESMCNLPRWEDLLQRLPNSPALQAFEIEDGKRRAAVALAEALGATDLTASAGLRHYQDSGEFAAVAAISIPLKIHNSNQDARRAAGYHLSQLDAQRQAAVLSLQAALLEQFQSVSTAHGRIVSIRDEILPSAEKAMNQSEEAYRKGRFTMTNLLAVRRTWFQWQNDYVTALAEYQAGIARIHQILGDSHTEILISQENN